MMCYRNIFRIEMLNVSSKVRLLLKHLHKRPSYSQRACEINEINNLFRLNKRYLSAPSRKDLSSEQTSGSDQQNSAKITQDLLQNAATFSDEMPRRPEDVWSNPYPITNTDNEVEKSEKSDENSPSKYSIVMFPGQGSQHKGMGKSLLQYSSVVEMYQTASEILNYDLLALCLDGPQEKLNETRYCQPAMLVTSLAAVQKLREIRPEAVENCVATLGFSVGEIASLVFAGALSFEAAVRLVQIRGEAMQAASDLTPSGMMTVFLGPAAHLELALEAAQEWAEKAGVKKPVCSVANYLYPSCKVIAGHNEALEFIEINHKAFRIKNTKRVAVSGAFHTPLMEPAVEAWKLALSQVTFSEPLLSVYSNVSGKPYSLKKMVNTLEQHLVCPVKWEQCLHEVYQRPKDTKFPKSYECGPGQSLKAILKRVNMKSWNYTYNIET